MSGEQKLKDLLNSLSEFEMVNDDFEVVPAKEKKDNNRAIIRKEVSNEIDNHDKVIPSVRKTCPAMKPQVSNFNNIAKMFHHFLFYVQLFVLLLIAFIVLSDLTVFVGTPATSNQEIISRLSKIEQMLPEEAPERFLRILWKHCELKDEDIFDEEFHCQEKTEKMTRDECIRYVLKEDLTGKVWLPHTAVFTDDGLLKIKFYKEKKMSASYLAKPNKNIEGGYKLYKLVDFCEHC